MSREAPHHLKAVALIGGGVHGVVVAQTVRAQGQAHLVGYTDPCSDDRAQLREMQVPYLGGDDALAELLRQGKVTHGLLGIAGLEHRALRRRLVEKLDKLLCGWDMAVHPRATVAESARIGEGTVVFAGAIVNPLAQIGKHVVVNTAAVIEHHARIGDFAVVSPHATLCGGVQIGESAFIGAGAVVLTDVRIGPECVVGAGAVVLRDVEAGTVVVGNPARPIERDSQSA